MLPAFIILTPFYFGVGDEKTAYLYNGGCRVRINRV